MESALKALVFNGPKDIRYENFDDPELGSANAAIVNVKQCSICGSDLHIYHGDHIGAANYSGDVKPFCVGHEFTGEVVEIGPDVRGAKVGDKVLVSGGAGCGKCDACRTANSSQCKHLSAFGLSDALNGGQAEYVNVPNADQSLMAIPDGVSDDQAVLMTDAAATAYFGTSNANIQPGGSVAVVGLGPIGLIGIELAFIMGAAQVFAIDPVEERRTRAAALGAKVFAPGPAAHAAILEATKGQGVQSVFEASGVKSAVESTLGLVARGGTLSFIGLPQPDVVLPMMALLYKNITVKAGVAPVPQLWAPLVPLFQQGRLKAQDLFTHRMSLSEGAKAYEMFDARADGVVKIMMTV